MYLEHITKDDFKIYNCYDEEIEFQFKDSNYKLRLADLAEISMSNYVYSDVKFFKNNAVVKSGRMQLPDKYYNPISPNHQFIYIPLRTSSELIDLTTNQKIESSVDWFYGNIYNYDASKMIINGSKEFKVIDLVEMKEAYHFKADKDFIKDAFFIDRNIIWRFLTNGRIEELNLETKETRIILVESPFEKYNIELEK